MSPMMILGAIAGGLIAAALLFALWRVFGGTRRVDLLVAARTCSSTPSARSCWERRSRP